MLSILPDESVPRGVAEMLSAPTFEVAYAPDLGLAEAEDATVLRAAEAFDVFITCDQNIVMQNEIGGLPFDIVVICTNNWPTILGNRGVVSSECQTVQPGTFRKVLEGVHMTRYGRRPKRLDPE